MKLGNLAETGCLASPEPPDHRATAATAPSEKRVSRDSRGQRVAPAAPASPVPATLEHPASVERMENPVYPGCRGNQVYPDREA